MNRYSIAYILWYIFVGVFIFEFGDTMLKTIFLLFAQSFVPLALYKLHSETT